MNTVWSTYVQGIGTLYNTRLLRFSDLFQKKYRKAFRIDDKKRILEIGCGPGALAESLARWYPGAQVFGIDRDSNFIAFAKQQNPMIQYAEGDATALAFENESVDVTISNTVAEHIEPSKFYGEQYRVLKEKGVCLVLSARRGINITAPCISEKSAFEKEIWKRAEQQLAEVDEKFSVCAYPQNESELPLCMEQYGFRNVTTEYLTVNLTPDNPVYTKETAHAMINANRQVSLDGADELLRIATGVVTVDEVEELKRIINFKYDKRIELYNKGIKQWDANVSVTMVIRGEK
ncbi:MAG: methyltransferase domain-containing protein [Lachnospiraceae bacterium]|nr:methyltransferase domain-containing protein [Lachnospiraceae bacterium]